MDIKEIQIPVPWGHISVKTWGSDKNQATLMVHGIFDNAGSFDRLIPLLSQDFYYICIDLPSHGKSSHFPPYLPIYIHDFVMVLKIILDYFNKKQYIIITHSLGGQISLTFGLLYPEYIIKLITIDTFFPLDFNTLVDYTKCNMENLIKINSKPPSPQFICTFEEAVKKCLRKRLSLDMTRDSAIPLVNRQLTYLWGGKYGMNVDYRLAHMTYNPHYAIDLAQQLPLRFPLLIISSKRFFTDSKNDFDNMMGKLKSNSNCHFKIVDGDHDVHNVNPEIVASTITAFLNSAKSKL